MSSWGLEHLDAIDYIGNGSEEHPFLPRVDLAAPSGTTRQGGTVQGTAASATTTTAAPADSSTAAPLTSFTAQQWQQLDAAITQAFDSVQGGTFTNQQIYGLVTQQLASLGWSGQALSDVQQSLQQWAGDTASQSEKNVKGKSNLQSNISSWWTAAQQNLQGIFSSAAASASTSSGSAAAPGATDPNLTGLLSALESPVAAPSAQLATPYSVPTTSTSSGPFTVLAIVGAIGLVGWWWYEKHKAGAKIAHAVTHHDVDGEHRA